MDFFDMSKEFSRVNIQSGRSERCSISEDCAFTEELPRRVKKGCDYVKEHKNVEDDETEDDLKISDEIQFLIDNLEGLEADTMAVIPELKSVKVTKKNENYYEQKTKPQSKLIINNYKEKILSLVEANKVIVLTAPVGCGKSTLVPQFILDSYSENNKYCNIVVTQPRRIAAISIAKRVCEDRDCVIGELCGYKVGLYCCVSSHTRLTYVTPGVLLQHLITKRNNHQYTHIILDEIHERDEITDFLLIVIKKLLKESANNVKVVLMSATIQAEKFADYFGKMFTTDPRPAPIISVPGSTNYHVQTHYLEELAPLGELPSEQSFTSNLNISPLLINICIELIKRFDIIDTDKNKKNSVLVFLPGLLHIQILYEKLTDPGIFSTREKVYKWTPLPLHSSITSDELAQIFHPPQEGYRKIILATNIAESSITVPSVKFVIDFCLMKKKKTNSSSFSSLELCWASQASCIQRAGRVGRVMDGRVYRMVYRKFYEVLEEEPTPKIREAPLDKVILHTKILNMGEPKVILALALDPPDLIDIEKTILTLKEAGGLLLTSGGVLTPYDGDLTYLGRLMALLPVDIHVTKLIVMGHLFGCLEECIIMGASLSLKSMFSYPFHKKHEAYNSKLMWANGSFSDCIAFLNVYEIWTSYHRTGYFKTSAGDTEGEWARKHFIQLRVLREVKVLVGELRKRLKENLIQEPVGPEKVQWSAYQKDLVLKIALAGAFYPNYFGLVPKNPTENEEFVMKELHGRNPLTTVYLNKFPNDQPAELYSQLIKDAISENNEDMIITSDGGSKVFMEFRKEEMMLEKTDVPLDGTLPGKIPMGVYRALKMRSAKKYIDIKLLPAGEAKERAEALGIKNPFYYMLEGNTCDIRNRKIPPALRTENSNFLELIISHTIDPGNFWAYLVSAKEKQTVIFTVLNESGTNLQRFENTPAVGEMCIAPHVKNGEKYLYRARVTAVRNEEIQVFFIDYGNSAVVNRRDLRRYTPEIETQLNIIPGLAFECVLCQVEPSIIMNPKGTWSAEAYTAFNDLTKDGDLHGAIYSIVNRVVSLALFKVDEKTEEQICVNKYLIEKGYAEFSEECYLSKKDHEKRMVDSRDTKGCSHACERENCFWYWKCVEPPPLRDRIITARLRGPYSPLERNAVAYVRSARWRQILINDTSVNSVLLDNNPQNTFESLIVAANVSQNADCSVLILDNTTVLPAISGLYALIPFIFAPKIELRVNKKRTRYTGMLCGLGAGDNRKALYRKHDMEVVFDCNITLEDLNTVNNLRHYMSLLLMTRKGEILPSLSLPEIIAYQKEIQSSLIGLLTKKRERKEKETVSYNYKWKLTQSDVDVRGRLEEMMKKQDRSAIFPYHRGVPLKPDH